MVRDPRGGSNRKGINEKYFKHWSSNMAYILGFIYADGALIDAATSTRTQYLAITNTDIDILKDIRTSLACQNPIHSRKAGYRTFKNGSYYCKEIFILRIGNREVFRDLLEIGLVPKKSLRIFIPKKLPDEYFRHFLRGYFDGDGCVNIRTNKSGVPKNIQIIFTSGCRDFLEEINQRLFKLRKTEPRRIYLNSSAYRLGYNQRESLNILSYIYQNLNSNLYLNRKFRIYQSFIERDLEMATIACNPLN